MHPDQPAPQHHRDQHPGRGQRQRHPARREDGRAQRADQHRQHRQRRQRDQPRQHATDGARIAPGIALANPQFGQQHPQCLCLAVHRDQQRQRQEQRCRPDHRVPRVPRQAEHREPRPVVRIDVGADDEQRHHQHHVDRDVREQSPQHGGDHRVFVDRAQVFKPAGVAGYQQPQRRRRNASHAVHQPIGRTHQIGRGGHAQHRHGHRHRIDKVADRTE